MTYIIDVSGSIDGPSIRQAKKALVLALNDLGADDLFNVIAFNDGYWTVFSKVVSADGCIFQRRMETGQEDQGASS